MAAKAGGPQGVRVNAILPGAVPTDMLRGNILPGQTEAEFIEVMRAHHPLGRLAAAEDIARAAGVSKMTVSRVLRDGSGFSDQTRRKVTEIAAQLGYVPNRLAAAFGSDQAETLVGMCVPRLTSGLFGHVLDGVDRALGRLGYQLIIGANDHSMSEEEAWIRQVVSWRPAGLILSGRHHKPFTHIFLLLLLLLTTSWACVAGLLAVVFAITAVTGT